MKKLISIILAAAICMSLTPAFAANADKMQEVLISVKERIDIPEEYSEFSSRERASENTERYNFTWRTKDGEKSVNVSAYNDGTITDYAEYISDYEDGKPNITDMSADTAKEIAEEFVKRINPDYPYELRLVDTSRAALYSESRNFPIEIYISGVRLLNDGGYVNVNTKTGKVTDFNIWYSPEKITTDFNSADEFIGEDAAKKAYSEKLGMRLIYRSYYDNDNKQEFYPVYVQNSNYNQYINALTGEVEEADYYLYDRGYGVNTEGMAAASMKSADLTPQEQEVMDDINGLVSKEEAEKQIKNNKLLSIPSDMKVKSISLYKDTPSDTYMYRIYMEKESEADDDYGSIYISADAKNVGLIYDFNRYDSSISDDGVVQRQDPHLLQMLTGAKSSEYEFDEEHEQYQRYVNGIEVEGDFASIMYVDGKLTHFHLSYSNADFPSIENAMSKEEAEKALFNQTEYKVGCLFKPYKDGTHHFTPVYAHEEGSINPFTGKLVNWRNEEITADENTPITYSDISGHWAESVITKLAEYGIGFEGGKFKPDEKITQSDLLTLLGTIYGGGDVIVLYANKEQADNSYMRAISQKIITEDERDDNAVLTRETASIYLIRAIGAEEYAKYNDIYVTPFDDVTENKGYIALLSAMGVVSGDGGHFNPSREITRAEFAVMIYNYLTK